MLDTEIAAEATGRFVAKVSWLGQRVCSRVALFYIHWMNQVNNISDFVIMTLVIVPEQVLVLFWTGTTSLRSGLGTFFVPELDHAKHFR